MRIAALDAAAERRGLRRGQGLADARAAHPDIDIVPADEAADRRLLAAIADWCDRYTPLVALDRPDGLLLDISGCAHLFGGEKAFLDDLVARLLAQGFAVHAAIASTVGVAWATARFSGEMPVVDAGGEAGAVASLPLAALRLDGDTIAGLAKVGLKTVGQLMETPRAPITRRFGRHVLLRLDQALGTAGESISPRLPVPDLSVERRMAEAIGRTEDVEQMLLLLAGSLQTDLERRGSGARALEFTLFRVDGAVYRLTVGASRALRDPETIVKLFRERLHGAGDEIDAGYGFDVLRLSVLVEGELAETQDDFSTGRMGGNDDVAMLLDRIAARLGGERGVTRLAAVESHIPERAEIRAPAHLAVPPGGAGGLSPRPVRLLRRPEPVEVVAGVPEDPPQRFRWRRVLYRVAKAEGPERIAGEWWDADAPEDLCPAPRDYYRVEDEAGRRYWLFREGLYDKAGEGGLRWFLHGMFA